MEKKTKKKPVRGRPPATWLYNLAELDREPDEFLDYQDLSKIFGLSLRMIHHFCTKAKVMGEYYKHEKNVIRKRFKVSELKKAAKAYVDASRNKT